MGQSLPLFRLYSSFSHPNINYSLNFNKTDTGSWVCGDYIEIDMDKNKDRQR